MKPTRMNSTPLVGIIMGSDSDYAHVDAVARENVRLVMAQIKERSPIPGELVRDGKVALVGGMYDLASVKVTFLE